VVECHKSHDTQRKFAENDTEWLFYEDAINNSNGKSDSLVGQYLSSVAQVALVFLDGNNNERSTRDYKRDGPSLGLFCDRIMGAVSPAKDGFVD